MRKPDAARGPVDRENPFRDSYCQICFSNPIPAGIFAKTFGWQHAYAVSHNVHQESWHLDFWENNLEDPYALRIVCGYPIKGGWTIDVWLRHRPEGMLPDIVCGPSPAYDLAKYSAMVVGFAIISRKNRIRC